MKNITDFITESEDDETLKIQKQLFKHTLAGGEGTTYPDLNQIYVQKTPKGNWCIRYARKGEKGFDTDSTIACMKPLKSIASEEKLYDLGLLKSEDYDSVMN